MNKSISQVKRIPAPRRRLVLLGGVSLLPLALSAICARPAHAQPCASPVSVTCTGELDVGGPGNVTVTSTGFLQGGSFGIENGYAVGTLVNEGGIIEAAEQAVVNTINGSIGILDNQMGGLIESSFTAVENEGTIAQLSNEGSISGGAGIGNFIGSVGTVINTGNITGNDKGVDNLATIVSLGNTGTITGYTSGVYDGVGTVDTLTNNGMVAATFFGVHVSQGMIGAIENQANGLISGGQTGILEAGTSASDLGFISALTNSGRIIGDNVGLNNAGFGSVGTLDNAATLALISGGTDGALNNGAIGTLINAGIITTTLAAGDGAGGVAVVGIENEMGGTIATLTNLSTGTISGGSSGIYNLGTIIALANSGLITGASTGVDNEGLVGALHNTGIISGNSTGIDNEGGTIGLLTNTGTIWGGSGAGILNTHNRGNLSELGSIGEIDNSGSISSIENQDMIGGNAIAISNLSQGEIGTLANAGTNALISGASLGIYNIGTIGALINDGTIIATNPEGTHPPYTLNAGILNVTGGTIAALANGATGLISSASSGITNEGSISQLSNAGVIDGVTSEGVFNAGGSIGTLVNDAHATIYGGASGISNNNLIDTLINNGTIIGGSASGIQNYGSGIGNLSNTGLISGDYFGIHNFATIAVLDNSGTIIAALSSAIYNDGGTIGMLVNSGTISGKLGFENTDLGTIMSLSNSRLIEGLRVGLQNAGQFGTLTNEAGGVISGGSTGLNNFATLSVLSNAGTIFGATATGVYNERQIATLANTGLIEGGEYGVYQEQSGSSASIGTLDNAGTIIGSTTGIVNYGGTIGQITNSGIISGGTFGIVNDSVSTIGLLQNAGLITGGATGIDNLGNIDVLTIAGIISGTTYGVNNLAGTINVFENTGLITGSSIAGVIMAAGTLENAGTIAGPTGVILTGDNASIFDSGTIASTDAGDAVKFEAQDPDSLTLTTGADIIGAIDGGTTAGSITLEGTGTLNAAIINFTTGSALSVVSGADWAGAGNWTIATLTNDGAFQGGLIGNALTLTGDFIQTPNGTLLVAVTPNSESQFIVTGTAELAGGLKYVFAPGTYRAGTYAFLTASGGITGSFASAAYVGTVPKAFTHATLQDALTGNLVLTTAAITPVSPTAPPPVVGVVAPADDAVFADANEAAALSAQTVNGSLLGKAAEGAAAASNAAACGSQAAAVNATGNGPNVSNDARLAATIGQAFCAAGGWVQATGGIATQNGAADAPGFTANMAGFLAGVDAPLDAAGTRLGLAVGYDEDWLKDGAGGKASIGTTRVGLYGSQPWGNAVLAADFMVGFMNQTSTRETGLGAAQAKPDGTVFEGGLQAAASLVWNGLTVVPAAGLRVALVDTNAFGETTPAKLSAFAVTGASTAYDSVQPYARVSLSHTYFTGNAIAVTPELSAGYAAELADRGKAVNVTAPDGTIFASAKPAPDSSAAEFSAGLSAGQGAWSLYAKYIGAVSGNWNAQSGEAGVEAKF
jgi:hypothetical protein